MQTRRAYLGAVAAAVLAGCGGSDDGTVTSPGGLSVSSSAFEDGESIPDEFTGVGADRSPPLSITDVPGDASSLAVILDDPDAPSGPFVHWLLWNVPAGRMEIPAGQPQRERLPDLGGARQGENGFGEPGYRGPLPPEGDGPHTYRFTVYALGETLDVDPGADREALDDRMADAVVASGRLAGTYERPADG
jgi:Raf kinase inhibitor-like YbhB/YbcL family protein